MENLGQRKPFFFPENLRGAQKKNTCIVIGSGRTGKTTLINTLTKLDSKNEPITNCFTIVTDRKNDFGKSPIMFYYTDYRGQNFSQLISNFIQEQLRPQTLIRYGDINSLILVVDVFDYDEPDNALDKKKELDLERIESHVTTWNKTALDAVFGLLTRPALKYVCLFINKIDKWENGNGQKSRDLIYNKFSSLIADLRERCAEYATFEVIIGSALVGTSVIGANSLLTQLAKYSVPPENNGHEGQI